MEIVGYKIKRMNGVYTKIIKEKFIKSFILMNGNCLELRWSTEELYFSFVYFVYWIMKIR